ncbi:hypothetical protein JHK84_043568 [Glycine max]|nr:hypothetical protein JHK84_043568 [Glycine max]
MAALCEELTRKAATLVAENENLKRIARSINTEVEKTPVEHVPFVVEIKPSSGNGPWIPRNQHLGLWKVLVGVASLCPLCGLRDFFVGRSNVYAN